MEYGKIVAVTGLPGLFELLSSKGDGAIVRSLEDKSTRFVSSRIHNFSHLESIEVFTVRDNVNLVDIFEAIQKSEEKLPDEKDNSALKKYFEKIYPDIDFERVYTSDLKKMIKWYDILTTNNIEIKLSEPSEEVPEEVAVGEVEEAEVVEKKQAKGKKPVAKKAAEKEEVPVVEEEEEEEKPKKAAGKKEKSAAPKEKKAKKTVAKKATKSKEEKPKKAAKKTKK